MDSGAWVLSQTVSAPVRRSALEGHPGAALDRDPLADHNVGLGERGVRVAGGLDEVACDVAGHVGVDQRGALRGGLLHVDEDGQRVVVGQDQLDRVLRDVAVGRDDHRDGLADVADLAARERQLGTRVRHGGMGDQQRQRPVERPQVVRREDRDDAGMRLGSGHVEARDARVRHRRAQERDVERPRVVDVVEVGRLATEDPRILVALDALAEGPDRHQLLSSFCWTLPYGAHPAPSPACSPEAAMRSAASRTAATICW
jgi:hypothetical protein